MNSTDDHLHDHEPKWIDITKTMDDRERGEYVWDREIYTVIRVHQQCEICQKERDVIYDVSGNMREIHQLTANRFLMSDENNSFIDKSGKIWTHRELKNKLESLNTEFGNDNLPKQNYFLRSSGFICYPVPYSYSRMRDIRCYRQGLPNNQL